MIKHLLEFWSFTNPQLNLVLAGSMILAVISAAIGTFASLQKKALIGDVLAHASLPGITTAFLILRERNLPILLCAGLLSALIGTFLVDLLVRQFKLRSDSALTIILTSFFALGLFQLSLIQKIPSASQAGIDRLLFGQAAAILPEDLKVLLLLAALVLLSLILFYSKFLIICFDPIFAKAVIPYSNFYHYLLVLLTALAVVLGIQIVGIVLMAAFLITPYAAARYWSQNLKFILLIASLFALFAALIGANISYLYPRMPSGPWIVVILSICFLISVVFAPKRGLLSLRLTATESKNRIEQENILRALYKLGENKTEFLADFSELQHYMELASARLRSAILRLRRLGLVKYEQNKFSLSETGLKKAQELTQFHRIWEAYLQNKLNLPADHLHADAEEMEHWINNDMAKKIIAELGVVDVDPHGSQIPNLGKKDDL